MQLDAEPLLAELAQKIGALPAGTVIVGIHTGGAWVAERLHAMLNADEPLCTLAVTLHRDDFSRIGLHRQKKSTVMPVEVEGRHLLLIDDVLASGRTVRAALNELFDFGRPASVKLAVLVDRGSRELPVAADYAGAVMKLDAAQVLSLSNTGGRLAFDLKTREAPA